MAWKKGISGNPGGMWKKGVSGNKKGRPKLITNDLLTSVFKQEGGNTQILRKQDIRYLLSSILSLNKNQLKVLSASKELPLSIKQVITKMEHLNGGKFVTELIELIYYHK